MTHGAGRPGRRRRWARAQRAAPVSLSRCPLPQRARPLPDRRRPPPHNGSPSRTSWPSPVRGSPCPGMSRWTRRRSLGRATPPPRRFLSPRAPRAQSRGSGARWRPWVTRCLRTRAARPPAPAWTPSPPASTGCSAPSRTSRTGPRRAPGRPRTAMPTAQARGAGATRATHRCPRMQTERQARQRPARASATPRTRAARPRTWRRWPPHTRSRHIWTVGS
mmetsp:Transcript_24984/g.83731  ORF Transcript_24984/g.83731 Transcript_24984/m.83731 type:complete len:220 (-) Transcript_24984:146-805(-)